MAGDWIKMRSNLWDDPRVSGLCDLTDSTEGHVIGGLYWLWAAADQHSEDGLMTGLTLTAIDRKTGIKGFGQALLSIGWISESDDGIVISRFEEHNGASAKRRSMEAQRKANTRKVSASDADKSRTESGQGAELEKEKEKEKEKELKEKTSKKDNAGTGDAADTERLCSPPGVNPSETEKPEPPPTPPGRPRDIPDEPPAVSAHGAICAYVRSKGMMATPSDQEFRDLITRGAEMQHFVDAVALAQERGKPWKYMLGIVKNMLQEQIEAAKAKPRLSTGPPPAPVRLFRKGWDSSPFGVHEVGTELGIPKREDEDEIQYRDRMRLAVKERETQGQQRSVA
jgi:hypothetical protein